MKIFEKKKEKYQVFIQSIIVPNFNMIATNKQTNKQTNTKKNFGYLFSI